jgi:hypothetical protein
MRKKQHDLSHKLKKAVRTLEVDVFGYRKRATRNIHMYFMELSQQTGIAKERIIIRVFKDYGHIRACIYHNGKQAKQIPVSELITVFTGISTSGLLGLERKVVGSMEDFIDDFSWKHGVAADQVHICIGASSDMVQIKGVCQMREIASIPLMVLIKHFM